MVNSSITLLFLGGEDQSSDPLVDYLCLELGHALWEAPCELSMFGDWQSSKRPLVNYLCLESGSLVRGPSLVMRSWRVAVYGLRGPLPILLLVGWTTRIKGLLPILITKQRICLNTGYFPGARLA